MQIDLHAHYYPPAYLDLAQQAYAAPQTPRERIERGLIENRLRKTPALSE